MSSKTKALAAAVLSLAILILAYVRLHNVSIPVLEPKGTIGAQEKHLILIAVGLCLIVVIPVYVMLVGFAWRYREGNKSARYQPDFDHSRWLESLWWGVPLTIITILAAITWHSSQELDPFRAISSSKPPMTIQVVSLQWKWLFIYPQQNIASVNFVELPVNTPINFSITSDAPMNSFWIPQLGGQIYAMSGMSTQLHLMASNAGDYYGSSANISGDGFAGMHFTARAASDESFQKWVGTTHRSQNNLDASAYANLAKPSQNNPVSYYGSAESGLFNHIVDKFITPPNFIGVGIE